MLSSPGLLLVALHLLQHRVQVERCRLLAWWELDEVLDLRRHDRLHQVHLRNVIDHPVPIGVRVEISSLERIATQVDDVWHAQLHEWLGPLLHLMRALHRQVELVVADPYRHDLAVIAEVHDGVSRACVHLAGEVWNHVVTVEMDVVLLATDRGAVQQLLGYVRIAGGREQRREHVDVRDDAVQDRTCLDLAGPAHEARHTPAAFPVGILLAAVRGVGAVRPRVVFRPVVG